MKLGAAALLFSLSEASKTFSHDSHNLKPLHQMGLSEVAQDQTPVLEDQAVVEKNAKALEDLRDDLKCFVDKLLWSDFEGMYIGLKNHMTFRSDIYLPKSQFDQWVAPCWVSLRVVDTWAETPAQVSREDLEKVLKSVQAASDYFARKNSNIIDYAKQYKNEDYQKVVEMYDESIHAHAQRLEEIIKAMLEQ